MASLQLSPCTVLTSHRISPLIPNCARQSRRFNVSCSSGDGEEKPSAEGGQVIDRRTMLMGLGGLHGAAKALADPIPAPDFRTCIPAQVVNPKSSASMSVQCCPPLFTGDPVPYTLPKVTKMRVRQSADTLDADSLKDYINAITAMKKALHPSDPRSKPRSTARTATAPTPRAARPAPPASPSTTHESSSPSTAGTCISMRGFWGASSTRRMTSPCPTGTGTTQAA